MTVVTAVTAKRGSGGRTRSGQAGNFGKEREKEKRELVRVTVKGDL